MQHPNICIRVCGWKSGGTLSQKILQTCSSVCKNKQTIEVSGANVAQLQMDFCQQTQVQVEIISVVIDSLPQMLSIELNLYLT